MGIKELLLSREWYTPKSTVGVLSCEGKNWFTLEDTVRQIKIPKVTAIPAGRYRVVAGVFSSVKQIRPLLLNVPNFQGVFIHVGNKPEDTEGCILPGKNKSEDSIFESGNAYVEIARLLCDAWNANQETWITVKDKEGHPWPQS